MNEPPRIVIEWRHFDLGDVQCGRCTDTGTNLWNVISELAREHLLDNVELELRNTLLPIERIAESNTVLINGIPVEHIRDAGITFTDGNGCPDFPGEPARCRTVADDRNIFEALPEEMLRSAIVKVLKQKEGLPQSGI